LLESC